MGRVLFVRAGALGDFVLTLPVLAALLREGEVDVACAPAHAALLPRVRGAERLGRVWDVGGAEALWMHGGRDPVGYTRAVVFSEGLRDGLRAAGIPRVDGVGARPVGPAGPWFARVLGGAEPVWPPLEARPVGPARVFLAPGASAAERRVPAEWWRALAVELADLRPAWVLGPQEADRDERGEVLRPGLVELVDLAAPGVWIGLDTGTTHLAAAAGARVVARFVGSEPAVWSPRGATVVTGDPAPAKVAAFARDLVKSTIQHDTSEVLG